MSDVELEQYDVRETSRRGFAQKMSSPMTFFWTMVIFLILVGFCIAILYRQAHNAFMTNPGLNGLILGVAIIGVLMVFSQVLALRREVGWLNSFRAAGSADRVGRDPKLLAPMRALIGSRQTMALSTSSLRSILDSIATRLDEQRDTTRYLVGLLVFLGLLGTFWGLLNTIGSIGSIIQGLDPNSGDSADVLNALKEGLSGPLSGMGTAFSSSLLGLSGSLVLGFLDLQAGRAQNRFYMELENWLSSMTDVTSDLAPALEGVAAGSSEQFEVLAAELHRIAESGGLGQSAVPAMAQLAEGIQGVVKNMRNEQQMLRDWIEAQQEESRELRQTLQRLADKLEGR
ncbi:flagellar motor protein MotA [Martelella sp. HB161492]|uniref:flagellar motor protein MotA n=1 Tax=Martelella sp. HB161492 TaxID=2720726 RepID=UPI001592A6FC|nr:flagellar motor protein MotA [Martelella sp. HB161492]